MRIGTERGFSMIELMVVVAIIGLLASVAVPTFVENAKHAKTTEVAPNLERIYSNSRAYVFSAHASRGSTTPIAIQFPVTETKTPAGACCGSPGGKCVPNPALWATSPTWNALLFTMDDPSYFQYEYESTGTAQTGVGSIFTARATGNLDCDATFSTFEMWGKIVSEDQDVLGSGGMFVVDGTE